MNIWGELLKSVSALHIRFFKEFKMTESAPVPMTRRILPFPEIEKTDDNYFWDPISEDPRILFHPVERVLIEGPLAPNSIFRFRSIEHAEHFFDTVTAMDVEWVNEITREANPIHPTQWIREGWIALKKEWIKNGF